MILCALSLAHSKDGKEHYRIITPIMESDNDMALKYSAMSEEELLKEENKDVMLWAKGLVEHNLKHTWQLQGKRFYIQVRIMRMN